MCRHVARMERTGMRAGIFVKTPGGKTPLVRPIHRSEDRIKTDNREM
jgi:hypothetical protein